MKIPQLITRQSQSTKKLLNVQSEKYEKSKKKSLNIFFSSSLHYFSLFLLILIDKKRAEQQQQKKNIYRGRSSHTLKIVSFWGLPFENQME